MFTIQQSLALFKTPGQEPQGHTFKHIQRHDYVTDPGDFKSPGLLPVSSQYRCVCCGPDDYQHSVRSCCLGRTVYLGCKLQARQGFVQMSLQWTNHDEHERLRVAAQRELQQIC